VAPGYHYWVCGSTDTAVSFSASIRRRMVFAALRAHRVALFEAPVQMLLFAAIDVAGPPWTSTGLHPAL